jgi:preprotein translocase subunit SecD
MPTNYTGRIVLILAVLLIAVYCIIPFPSLFDKNLTFGQKLGLKPGIDMVGGVSLLYEIKPPEGGGVVTTDEKVINQVMDSLKKRVDPNGVMNLIWRPQGATRLEIRMPTSKTAGESQQARQAFGKAQQAIEATNIRAGEVIRAVEKLTGDARKNRINELTMGSEQRSKLFNAMASVFDQLQDAKKAQDAAKQAEKEIEYENLKKQIDDTNLPASSLEATLGLGAAERDRKLADLKSKNAGFDARLKAIDQFAAAYTDYS